MEKYKIVEFAPKYTNQVIKVIDKVLKEIGTLPESSDLIDDPDLRNIDQIYKDGGRFWVALVNNRVIGTVAIRDMGQSVVKLNRMFVLTEYHGTGLGQDLYNTAIQFAKRQGFKKIILNTHHTMKRAHSFYEKNGFIKVGEEEDKYHYEKHL
jgi:GNAT superfamily N-acetyltransferase